MSIQNFLSNEYNKIYTGLVDLSRNAQKYSLHLPTKLNAMESIYLGKTPGYSEIERKQIKYFREAFSYKFHLTTLHLEQLWSLEHHSGRPTELYEVLSNIFDNHQFIEDNLSLLAFSIEGFIIQGSAFLDFYMLYICSLFRISGTDRLTSRKFLNKLKSVENESFVGKAENVGNYFSKQVFGGCNSNSLITDNWGELLKNLRNSLVHRDQLFPDFLNNESLLQKVIGGWPEGETELTCSRFCQDVHNVMFYLVTDLAEVVYGLEYKPGPYKPGMWK